MDIKTLIAEAIKALAWPIIILAIALLFRKPLAESFPALLKLRYKGLEAEFGEGVRQVMTSGQLPDEERARRASSLLASLEPLVGKTLPGGRQIDVSLRVFQGDRLLAEKVVTNPQLITPTAGTAPIDFEKLTIEISAHPLGGGPSRKARISGL